MEDHPKARTIRAFYAAFGDSDPERAVRHFLHLDIRWHVAGDNPLAGEFVGQDEVWQAMARCGEHSQGTLRLDTRSIFADDEHAVAIHDATAERPGVVYRAHEVDVFHVEGNLITRMWSFSEDQAATDGIWS